MVFLGEPCQTNRAERWLLQNYKPYFNLRRHHVINGRRQPISIEISSLLPVVLDVNSMSKAHTGEPGFRQSHSGMIQAASLPTGSLFDSTVASTGLLYDDGGHDNLMGDSGTSVADSTGSISSPFAQALGMSEASFPNPAEHPHSEPYKDCLTSYLPCMSGIEFDDIEWLNMAYGCGSTLVSSPGGSSPASSHGSSSISDTTCAHYGEKLLYRTTTPMDGFWDDGYIGQPGCDSHTWETEDHSARGLFLSSHMQQGTSESEMDCSVEDSGCQPVAGLTRDHDNFETGLLACPFYKNNARKYHGCLKYKLQRIKDIKQHIYRKHMKPDYYCPRCLQDFTGPDARDEHIRKSTLCTIRGSCTRLDGISLDKKKQLNQSSSRGKSVETQWQDMWKVLFPNETPPKSVYLGNHVGEMMPLVKEFWSRRGPAILSNFFGTSSDVDFKMLLDLFSFTFERFEAESSGFTPTALETKCSRNHKQSTESMTPSDMLPYQFLLSHEDLSLAGNNASNTLS